MQVGDSDSRKEGIIVGDMKFGKIIREQMKGVMTQESNTVDRTKKISWGY